MVAQRGVALGLFSEDAGWSYRKLLDEIAQTGADTVELVVPWYLDDVHATSVHEHPRFTPPASTIARAIRDAHAAGLAVLLFPILRLERQRSSDEWRGTLAPADRDRLMVSYGDKLVDIARLAAREHAELLSVGSELSTLDGAPDHARWAALVTRVRAVFSGRLLYSGNWDHYAQVALYDLVDFVGLCAYFKLHEPGAEASDAAIRRRWQELRGELLAFAKKQGRPLVLTEVGYLSQRGATAWPWDEGASEPVDLEEQRRAYEAFVDVWKGDLGGDLGGVYFWNWYGWGGPASGGYTPRGKPATEEMRRFFRR